MAPGLQCMGRESQPYLPRACRSGAGHRGQPGSPLSSWVLLVPHHPAFGLYSPRSGWTESPANVSAGISGQAAGGTGSTRSWAAGRKEQKTCRGEMGLPVYPPAVTVTLGTGWLCQPRWAQLHASQMRLNLHQAMWCPRDRVLGAELGIPGPGEPSTSEQDQVLKGRSQAQAGRMVSAPDLCPSLTPNSSAHENPQIEKIPFKIEKLRLSAGSCFSRDNNEKYKSWTRSPGGD